MKYFKIKVIQKLSGICKDYAVAKAYKGIFLKKEIGTIGMTVYKDKENSFFQIEHFRVRESFRKQGIGRKLISAMIEEAKKADCCEIIVYPESESYEGEHDLEIELLYRIYEKYGFKFTDESASRNISNNKMILVIGNFK